MGTSEPARFALYNRLGEAIGLEHAETLMSSLPVQPAVGLATKHDIAELRAEIRELRAEIRELRAEIHDIQKAIRQQMMFTLGAMTALTGIFSIIVGLIT